MVVKIRIFHYVFISILYFLLFSFSESVKKLLAAEIEVMKLKDQLEKVKRAHEIVVAKLKTKIQEEIQSKESMALKLWKYQEAEKNISVSNFLYSYFVHQCFQINISGTVFCKILLPWFWCLVSICVYMCLFVWYYMLYL